MKPVAAVIFAALMIMPCATAFAEEVSQRVKNTCHRTASATARTISYALRSKVDPATQVKRVADSWLEGVQTHMLLAASQAPHLSEQELTVVGYSYCIERRPTNSR